MSEWIFPDHEWDDEPADLGRLESYTALARARKETTMTTTKKTAAKTTADNAKETTMTTITMPENARKMNLAAKVALHNEWMPIIMAANVTTTFTVDDVKNASPNKGVANITNDPVELEFLPYVAAFFGWEDTEFCYESQAKECGGKLRDGAQGWPICWKPQTTKSGPNAGKTTTFCQFVYPKSAFEWAYGEPMIDDDAIADKELDALIRATNRQIAKLLAAAKERGVKLQVSKAGRYSLAEKKGKETTKSTTKGTTKGAADILAGIDPALIAAIAAAVKAA